jgi:hypothetical protein
MSPWDVPASGVDTRGVIAAVRGVGMLPSGGMTPREGTDARAEGPAVEVRGLDIPPYTHLVEPNRYVVRM